MQPNMQMNLQSVLSERIPSSSLLCWAHLTTTTMMLKRKAYANLRAMRRMPPCSVLPQLSCANNAVAITHRAVRKRQRSVATSTSE